MVTSATLKTRARKRLVGNWVTVVLVAMFVASVGLILDVVISIVQTPFAVTVNGLAEQLLDLLADEGATYPQFERIWNALLNASLKMYAFETLSLVGTVFTWAVMLPADAFMMGINEGDKVKFGGYTSQLKRWKESLWLYFLMSLKVFLWTLLFIIPGIIKTFSYMLAPMLKVKNPERSANDCIKESCRLMNGNKANAFAVILSFIGWYILVGLVNWGAGSIPVIGAYFAMVVGFVTSAILSVYVDMTVIEFYREVVNPTPFYGSAPAPQTPKDDVFEELKSSSTGKDDVFEELRTDPPAEKDVFEELTPKPTGTDDKPKDADTETGTQYAPNRHKDGDDER